MDNNNITYRVVTNQGKEKEYSESEYLKNNVAGYLEKYLPGQYTVHKLEKVNNAVPQAILDDGDYLMSVPNLDGTMSSKVYKGKELKDRNLIDDYFDKNFLGKYTMQRVRSYDNADIAYRGDALEAKAYMDRNAIDDFDARNNAFMEEYKQKKAAYDLASGFTASWKDPNFLKTADYVVTSKKEYDKLKKERRRLQREYEDNPLVKGAYQNLAQSAQASADLNLEKENSSSGQDYNNYKHARKFDLDAAQLYALPVFTGDDSIDKNFWKGMGAGVADVFEDRDFWTLGITELARNVGVSKIFEGLKEKGLDISEMSEQDFDYYLTDSQKSLLFSFMRYGEAAVQRSGNMPKGYSVGQASAGTLGYMTQFLITGGVGSAIAKGVGKAATKAVAKGTANGLTKFLSRAYGKGVKGAIEQSVKRGMVSTLTADGNYLTSAMKPVINATAKTAGTVYEYGVKPIARSVARTPFMMSTYVAASEDLLERAQSTEELGSIGSAFLESVWNALPDQLIENWSEDMGPAIGAFGGAAKKGIMKAAGATVGKINVGKISLGQWGKWVADSYANKVLLQAGFNGLVGEMAEEWIGNAARVAVGLMDKEEFDEFASPKQQIEMAISFAPMSLLGLGSSSVAAAKQSKEYKSSVAEMRGVLNRAGMTEEEISDILDTKHSKQEIADALTPVLSKILSNATTENGQTTSVDDYKATLRFARNIAANEVMSAAEDIYKQELRMRVREQLSEELGAVSMDDPRGKFSYDIPMEGGNSLEAVTLVEDENGHKYYYMGEESSQVLLKPSNGGDVLFVDKKTYEDKASSGEYKVHTQSTDSFLDAYASVEQEKAETAARDKHLNDSRKQIIDTYKTNPSINLGTNETPKVGTVTGFLPDGLVVEFENPVEINGVTKKIHKVSYEQAGNAIGVDSTYRTEAEVAQDEADSIMRKQKEVSVYNGKFKGMEFTNDGNLYKFVRMVDAPYQDENGVDVVKVAAQYGTEVVEVTLPLDDLKDRLDKQKTAQLQAEQTKAGVDASKEDDGTPKDFRGNPLPMKTNDSGEQEVDTDALWNKDPEAFLRWNDERRGGTTEDSQELLSANIAKLQAQRQALVDKKSVETVPSEREAIDGNILALDNTINLYSAILQKYQAESNYKQKTQEYAAAFADLQRRMLNAKKQEQYDELKRVEAELMRKYLDETADSAQNIQLAKTCADLQLELNKFADMPVSMVTYANVESVMRENGASDEAIQSVMQKMAVVNSENLLNGHSYVLKGCHNNGMIYIFAEGNANIDSARTTYYHERQHELNARGDSAAVNEVMDLAKGDAEALYMTLEAIVGESVASNYKGSSAGVLADEIVAFTIQEAYSNENYTQALRDLGLSKELITIITKEYGRQTGKENSVSERPEDGHQDERRSGRKSANQNERVDEGESSNEQLGGVRQGDTSEHGEEVVGRSLTSDEADALLAQMENSAEVAPEIELTPDNWLSQFGEDGLVDTPIGKVKMGENQYFKLARQGRNGKLGLIKPTLESPSVIIKDSRRNDNNEEREYSYVFVKTFIRKDGERYYYFASVTIQKDGREVIISNQEKSKNRISKLLQNGKIAWIDTVFSLHPITQIEESVPLNDSSKPTNSDTQPASLGINSSNTSSEGTKSEPKKQDNNELSSFASEMLNDTLAQLPEELKGRVTVNESSTGDESYENFIQSYNIDGKPSGITRIELFDANLDENPTRFVIDGSDVDASREEQDRWESLADEYMKEHPEVNLINYDEVGIGFKSFMDAYNFLKWAEQRRESPIQGLENYSRGQIKEMVREHVARVLADAGFDVEVLDIEIHGSRNRGDAKNESDLDVVVEYKGAEKEDGLFNVLNDEDDALFIDGIKVDINPIRAEESGTMSDYMKRSEAYDKEKLNASTAQSTYQKKEWNSDSDVNEMKARVKYLERALEIGTEESKEVFPEYDAYKAERNELKKRAPEMQPDDVQKALAAIEDKYKKYNERIRAIYDELSNLNDSIAFSDQKEREKETSEKKAQQSEDKRTKYNGFLGNKTALAASSADKALSKKSVFDSGEMTLAEFVESHFADGSLKFEIKKEQSYPSRARWNRMDQKEQSEWMEKHKPETVYVVNGYVVNKTAYDYAEFLSKTKSDPQKQSKENDTAHQQNESPREYIYRLNVRPFGIGNQPDGGRKVDDGSKFGAVAYDKPLSIDDIKHYTLTAITEAKQLEGKMFSVPFGKNKLVYNIVSVDENGNITYTMKSTREGAVESVPQSSTYAELKDRFNGKETEVKVSADNENGQEPTSKQKVDSLGNPLNDDGTLKLEVVHSIDELTDEDFTAPTRNVQLPTIPKNIDDAIGAEGKPVIIKKNIFEKNRKNHSDLSSEQSRGIIESALYSPSMYGQNQKTSRPYNWILIHNAKKHSSVILEVSNNKDNVEIVNWHYLDDATLKQKQAIKEGGLILTLESAAGNTQDDLSSNDKGNKKEPKSQKEPKAPKAKRPDPLQFVRPGGEEVEHPAIEGVYHSDGMIVATDAHVLLAIKSDYPAELEGKITDKQGQVIEHKYPNWKSPFDRKVVLPVDVNLEKLALFLEQIKSQVPTERQAKADTWKSRTVFIDFGNGTIVGFEYYRLVKFVNAARFLNAKLSLTNNMLFGEAEDGKLILINRPDTRKAATFDAQKGEGKLLVDKKGDPLDNEEITSEPAQETPVPEQSPETRQEPKERIEDVGEKIAGARKDMLREYAASMGNVNVESLISLPFSKVFKRPNLNKAVENGALRARDARFAEAVMSAFLSNAKPRLNPSSTSYKRNEQEKNIKVWAEKAYVGIQLLSELFNADEAERDAIIERVLSEKAYKEQEIEERKAELKSWNNGREFNGQCYPVNPVAVFMKVYEQLDYNTYGEQKCPIAEIEPDSFFEYYRLSDANGKSKYYPKRKLNSVDAVIDEIVYATKLENADSDTDHPMSTLFFKGEGRTVVNGKVEYEKYNALFDAYGKQVEIGQSFSSKEEGVSWVEEHHDEYNDIVNKQLAEEKAAKNERSQSQDVLVERYWDVGAKKSRYAITLSDKYVPKSRDVFNAMPYSIADGFETKEAAEKYLESHKAEIDSIIADIAQTRRSFTYFDGDAKSRVGEDYRKGKDVSAEEFRSTFGFRGVQFGEWANQADRQAALNNAYDSFLDLAKFLGISPLAISLNGELGMAFGSRGRGGKAAAHYELEEVVINLTKPSGAGSLAHEWWHALDNYFARQSNVPLGMVTETKTIPMRDEMRKAYNQLIDNVEKSNYNKRSRQRGAGYWGSMVEETARLFETWVFDELHKRGENNHFLTSQDPSYEETFARNSYRSYINMLNLKNEHRAEDSKEKVLTFEEFKETPMALMGYVYPTQKELTEFDHDLRNIFGTVRERTDEGTGKVALFSIGKKESSPSDALSNNTEAKQLAFDAAMTMLDNAGVPVESLSDKAMRQMAEMANALETASVLNEHQPTVVSSASGTKVIKDIDKLTKELQNVSNYPKTILGDIAKALGAEKHGSNSQYVTFEAKNGKVVTIRLASHNAKTSTFDNHGEDTGISIVISARENDGVNNDGKAHVTEFYYDAIKLRKAEGKPLVEIVKSIKQTLFSGEYKDTTGLAQIEEVNADALPEFMTVYHGSGAVFDKFDHSHIGEGEGNQAFGWGTYVTEVEGIGRTYAEDSTYKDRQPLTNYMNYIMDRMDSGVSFEDAKNELLKKIEKSIENQPYELLSGAFLYNIRQLRTLSEEELPKRVLYTVDIPDDISSQPSAIDSAIRDKAIEKRNENPGGFGIYLHWERKVSAEQYPMWIKAMQFLGVEGNFASVEEFKSYNDNMSSIDIGFEIRTLSKMLGPQKVSESLHKAGFTGISYPAEYTTGGSPDNARNYVIFDENDLKITDRVEFLRNGDIVYGAVVGGRILLNKEHLNPNTPIHEYTHLWDKACQENNPELWLRGVELMKATPLWDELRDDPNYSALDDRALASEVHARLSGENGAAILEKMSQKVLDDKQSPVMAKAKKLAVIEELKDWLGDFWAWLKDTMTGWTKEEASEVSLEDFIKMPISDLAKGVNLSYTKELSLFDDIDLQDNLDGPVRFSVAEDEANSIVEKAKADGTFMKAPNGKPSNLNECQWAQVRTTSFKNWFGDWEKAPSSSSKVIDENGEPLVVYHGGPYKFYEFDKSKMGRTTQAESAKRGFFFTDSRSLADLFAEGAADGSINEAELIDYIKRELSIKPDEDIKRFFDAYKESDLAYEEFLEENDGFSDYDFLRGYVYEYIPTDVEKASERELKVNYILDSIEKEIWSGWFDKGSAISKKLSGMDIEWGHTEPVFLNLRNPIVDDIKRDYYNEGESINPMAPVMDSARRLNRDGVIFTGIYEEGRHQKEIQYVVFEPNQIKTAVDNNGEFSTDNDDIRYSIGDFRDGLDKQDDIYDAFVDILSSNGDAATLMEALEEYYNGSVRSASSGAKRAMEDGLLPFPGKQYAGKDFEYHHIMFESNDGDTFVNAVPFDTQDKVEAIIINKKFNNKLQEQIDGTLRNGFIYELGYPSNILINTGVPSLPIELSSSHLAEKAKQRNHQFDLSDIKDLPIALQNPIAVFAYGNKDKAQNTIVAIERDEKKFVVGIHFNQERKGLVVNDIRGIFNKDNAEWLNWINQGKALYLNKEEIQALIDKQRTNLAEVEYLDLDSVAKIVKDFENPISADEAELEESGVRYSIVDDPATLRRLDAEPKMKVYRAMQLVDGKLYPPMSGKVNGEWREGLSVGDLGKVWEQADENPELVDENGRFTLNKGNGKSLKARYNPYIHTSVTPLNDQFSSAQDRPELVTVEVEVPVSELYSQYKAEKAKDKVGAVEWKAGVVQAKLSGKRTVILSRWDRPMRIVPNSEVADEIVKMFNGKKITMPSNVVTPELRAELEKRGVPFVETDNKGNRIKDSVEFSIGEGLSEVNEKFNEDLSRLTEANADSITLSLGRPSRILLAAGVIDKPMKLYGNKVIKKMKKHGFELEELRDLPRAVAEPIAVFNNYGEDGNRAILTELKTADRHILVSLVVGKDGVDADFNIVSSVFGKGQDNIVDWITKGYLTYINKEKALQYLHFSESSIPEASNPERLSTATKVVKEFVNPTLRPEDSVEFSIESLDNKNELLFGHLERDKEFGVLMGIYDALPDDVRGEIIKRAPSFGYNFASATAAYFAKLSTKEGSFSKEEWELIRDVRDLMKSHLGIRELSLYDALWALCRMAYKDQLDILSSAYKALAAHKLGFSTSELAKEKATTDAVNFSISEDMKSSSAAEMYAKATSYFKNRLKEGAVDMFTSINDLVEAIELATGEKADAFEDIRLALNQQSSKGLAEMENYTRAYLQPMFDTIGRIVNNTGLSYEDLSRYVILKHAVERNVVFAKRDAKAFYKNILNSTVNTLEKDNAGLNKKRKSAVMDGDRETLAAIDKQIDDNNVLIAKAKADYEAALKRIESGNDIKYNEFREQDYGGLTSMYSEYPDLQPRSAYKTDEAYNQAARKVRKPMFDNVADMEEAAIKEVADFENKITIPVADELWDRINAATKATLDGQYQSNMLSKEQYEAVRGQFKYYVPLRGFKDITAEDIWSYYNSSRSDSFAPAIISAKGRTTEAENPFNWIGTMASSSIAAGVKNRTKLALYYFIANRPNQDLVSLGETWYRYDPQATSDYQSTHPGSTKRIFSAVYPPVTDGLDPKAAKDAYAAWENDLKAAKEKGEAYQKKGKLNVNDDVAFIDAKQTPEHIIRCRVLGSEVDMIINSNPRAAQAVNGLLNLETDKDYKVVFGKILRYLSTINTSLNPEFWISNMQRDLLFGVMSSFINGNDVKSFGKNILSPRRLMKLMISYRNGTLGNSKRESYYREFAENGAITGYTVINSNDYWEQKIQATIDPKFPDKVKASKFLAAWQNLGEATEQMTRFAAYVTARENGQDVVTAVSAAKEITVNFNRKGSGKAISMSELRQLLKKNGEHLSEAEIKLWHVVSFIPAYGRRTIMFFNAGVQALNAMYKLYAKDSRRFASCMLGYFLLGVAGALAHGLLGGDDDDNDYLDMPDYTRQNNLLLGCNGIYFKWALPQEARVFYAFGDMFVNHLMGRSPHKNLLKEMSGAINDMLPLPLLPFGVEFRDFVPSVVQPIADIVSNKDFTGSRVYNDLKYLSDEERKRTPRYQYALSGTGSGFVDASKFLNILSGGNEYDAGWVNVPPEVMQYIVETLGGGLLTTVNRGIRTLSGTVDAVTGKDVFNQDLSVRNAPFLNRVLIVNDERTRNAYVTGLFNYYKSEALHAKSVANRIGKKEGLSAKRKYMHSSDYEVYKVYDKYQSELKRYDSQIREETDAAERKSLMRRQDEVRRKMVKEMTTKNR